MDRVFWPEPENQWYEIEKRKNSSLCSGRGQLVQHLMFSDSVLRRLTLAIKMAGLGYYRVTVLEVKSYFLGMPTVYDGRVHTNSRISPQARHHESRDVATSSHSVAAA